MTFGESTEDGIALVGIGCRVPGAHGPMELWQSLCAGRNAVTRRPENRSPGTIDQAPLDDPATQWGGFIEHVDTFDPEFFGISGREAIWMDPQQRLLLEVAWEALEDAGLLRADIAGTSCGVFAGADSADHWNLLRHRPDIPFHAGPGSAFRGALAGRISYAFGLHGPSMSVDTAASSSLTATHLAVQALRSGEATIALACGVKVNLTTDHAALYATGGSLAADGRCKFGDATADGFVRSEGVGVLVLRPLRDAVAHGDRIYAVIKGSAVSHDGRDGDSFVAPAVAGQQRAVRAACAAAGISPGEVDYVEAHGTGTPVGDPVELRALGEVLGDGRDADRPCLVGSVKTNIGHLEAAAGVVGVIKAALCVGHRVVPPSLHFERPNPAVAWDDLPIVVPTRLTTLPERGRPPIAGVNSVGISGTNVHVVLTGPPEPGWLEPGPPEPDRTGAGRTGTDQPTTPLLLPLSAPDKQSLVKQAIRYTTTLESGKEGAACQPTPALPDLCYTATRRRTHHRYRTAVVGRSATDIAEQLRAFAEHDGVDTIDSGTIDSDTLQPRLAFVFSGHGCQWAGMAPELLASSAVFRAALQRCDAEIRQQAGWSVLDVLENADPDEVMERGQPALWAMQVALCALWRSCGVEPDVVIGHSMGEVAAAHASGALDLTNAAKVILRRSALLGRIAGQGSTLWTPLAADEATELADKAGVEVACFNAPHSTVLSGSAAALAEIADTLAARDTPARQVKTHVAAHSAQVDCLLDDLGAELNEIQPSASSIPLLSTVTAQVVPGTELGAAYWQRNLRAPVRFADAVQEVAEASPTLFVEISPHPMLAAEIDDGLRCWRLPGAVVASLRRGQGGMEFLLRNLGKVYAHGGPIDWAALYPSGRVVSLPPHPWRRQRYWPEPVAATQSTTCGEPGERVDSGTAERPVTSDDWAADIPSLPERDRRERVLAAVRREVSAELMVPAARIDQNRPLADYGLDSLMARTLGTRLARTLLVDLSTTALFGHPTINAMTDYLTNRLGDRPRQPGTAAAAGNRFMRLLHLPEASGGE